MSFLLGGMYNFCPVKHLHAIIHSTYLITSICGYNYSNRYFSQMTLNQQIINHLMEKLCFVVSLQLF